MKKVIIWLTVVSFGLAVFKYVDNREGEVHKAVYPKQMNITDVLTVNGTVEENNRKDVYLDATAQINDIYVKPGDEVLKGDILASVSETEGINVVIPSEYIVNSVLRGGVGEAVYCSTEDGYIRSPIDGTVMSINFKEGEKAGVIMPLFSVSDLDDLKISAHINEDSIHKIKTGMSASIHTNTNESTYVKGRIASISPYAFKTVNLLSAKDNPSKTEVKFDILEQAENIMPGYSVTIKLVTDTKQNALTIPYEYIHQNNENEQYVYVLGDNGAPEMRIIETGYELETVCEVRMGLKEDDLLLMYNEIDDKAIKIQVKNANK